MSSNGRPESVRVLLVEDDEDDHAITRQLLTDAQRTQFTLDWVASFSEAVLASAARAHDVYLVDYRLGAEDGLDFARHARSSGDETPIIILTGVAQASDVDLVAARMGIEDYLVKGRLDAVLLERSIHYALESSRTLRALRVSEERYALAVQGANDGVWDWDLQSETLYFSPRWYSILGLDDPDPVPSLDTWLSHVHRDDVDMVHRALDAHLQAASPHLEIEHRVWHSDGNERWVISRGVAIRDSAGAVQRMAGSMGDITARKRVEEQLSHDALHDALTGLPNRVLFLDRVQQAIGRACRTPASVHGVIYLDLNRFKRVNDSLGHYVGDRLLTAVARRLETSIRPGDTVARLGGDEFAFLVEDVAGSTEALAVADRIRRSLSDPLTIDGHRLFASASIGITLNRRATAAEMVRDADIAMYQAKERHAEGPLLFEAQMHDESLVRLQIESTVRRASDPGGVVPLAYQPIVNLADLRVTGVEALLRLKSLTGQAQSPLDVVSVAEETDLIVELGNNILRTACQQLAQWRARGIVDSDFTISINASRLQLVDHTFADGVASALAEYGLGPGSIIIEVTETSYIQDPAAVEVALRGLRACGVEAAIDDFGTGYSSLTFLRRFSGSRLKIDRSFVNEMTDSKSIEIVRTVCDLARTLTMQVIAEGVETQEQLQTLRELNCECGQGYLFGRPAPPEEAGRRLSEAALSLGTHGPHPG